jgi:hypothetical protein
MFVFVQVILKSCGARVLLRSNEVLRSYKTHFIQEASKTRRTGKSKAMAQLLPASSRFRGATKYYAAIKHISFKKQVRQGAPEKVRRRRSCYLRRAAFEEQRSITQLIG